MELETYDIIAQVERTHWWYRGRRAVLGAVVDAALRSGAPSGGLALDFGCGTGANLSVVGRCGGAVGVDFSSLALRYSRERGGYRALAQGDGTALPFADATFDWAFALDILEHLDEDGRAARELHRVLRPGGRLLITVPAFPALWGTQDDVSHHRRRYTRPTLLALVRGAGFDVERHTFINSALFLPIYLVRRAVRLLGLQVASENTLHPGWANPLLERLFAAEAHVVPRVSLPFGVSLLCVARRAEAAAAPAPSLAA